MFLSKYRKGTSMGITIKEIAEIAGVHRSTVDKVLHKRPGVSDAVRQRVQKIIDECNYQTNPIGKALKMQDKELQIRVMLLEVDARSVLKRGIEEELKRYDTFQLEIEYITIPYSNVKDQASTLEKWKNDKVDGIIISPINSPLIVQKVDECDKAGIPIITVNTDVKGSKRLCFIGQDGYKAGQVAGKLMGMFLQGQGKVAVFTSDADNYQSFPFGTREEGFREFMKKQYPEIEVLPNIYTREKSQVIRKEMRKLCEREDGLTGILITCGGVRAIGDILEEYDRQDINLICYENYPEILEMLERNIVTVTLDSDIEEQGRKAFKVLMDYLIYNIKPEKRHMYSDIKILLKECL